MESLFPLSSGWATSTVLAPHNQAAGSIKPSALQNAKGLTQGVHLLGGRDTDIRMAQSCTMLLIPMCFPHGADLPLHGAHPQAAHVCLCVHCSYSTNVIKGTPHFQSQKPCLGGIPRESPQRLKTQTTVRGCLICQ